MRLEIVRFEDMRPYWAKARRLALKEKRKRRERFIKGLRWIVK